MYNPGDCRLEYTDLNFEETEQNRTVLTITLQGRRGSEQNSKDHNR